MAPEINRLRGDFRITIISSAPESAMKREGERAEVPSAVEILHHKQPGVVKLGVGCMAFLFSKAGHKEMSSLREDGFSIGRFFDSALSYAHAFWLRRFCRKRGIFDKDNALYYSFWFNSHLLALVLEKNDRANDMKVVSRLHGYDLYNGRNAHLRQPFQRFKRDGCDRMFFASANAKEAFKAEFGDQSKEGQYVISRLGVANSTLDGVRKRKGRGHLIVSCSNVLPIKHVEKIAQALITLDRDDIQWVHFGDGPLLDKVKASISRERFKAEFRGHVVNERILEFYRDQSIDAVILLSESEGGCPVCLQEAAAYGIPLIGTDVGGVAEVIQENGILLPSSPDIQEVAMAIQGICDAHEDDWLRMSASSREVWSRRFDVDVNKKAFKDILFSLISE